MIGPKFNGIPYISTIFWSKPDSWFSIDACLTGGGGYFNGEFFHFSFSDVLIAARKYINQFELFILWKAVEIWSGRMR